MPRRTTAQFVSLALAALMTIGMLRGVDHLAVFEAAQGAGADQLAQSAMPAATHDAHRA